MGRERVLTILDELGIAYRLVDHEPVFTVEQAQARAETLGESDPDSDAKNLFLRDDRKRDYYLVVLRSDRELSLSDLQQLIGSRRLGFASERDLVRYLGVEPGAVGPLAVVNDAEHRVQVYLDDRFRGGRVGVHPNDNTATLWLATDDLVRFVTAQGNQVRFLPLD